MTKRISVSNLRILTYTILIKAGFSMVMLFCVVISGIAGLRPDASLPDMSIVFVVALTVEFVNIVACVMSLGGITDLSDNFITTQRIMLAALMIECLTLLIISAVLYIDLTNGVMASQVGSSIMLILASTEKLLTGAAFMFLMNGFGDSLRQIGDNDSAAASERLGIIYLYVSIASVAMAFLISSGLRALLMAAGTLLTLTTVILEILMFITVSNASQRIWKKHAFESHE